MLSPDGAYLAFTATVDGKTSVWVRPMNSNDARSLPDTSDAIFPFWSPDSRSIGYFAGNKLKTIEIDGGASQVVCDVTLGRGGAWGPGGVIVFSASPVSALWQVNASGGTPTPLTKLDASQHTSHRWPFFLPDGKHFLYLAMHHDPSKFSNNAVYYASLDGRENRLLIHAQTNAIYAAGFLLFGRGDQLMAQPFDPAKGALSGQAQAVSSGVLNDVTTWHMDASAMLDKAGITEQHVALCDASKHPFYNTSKFTLRDLKSRASQQQLLADFEDYLNGFSENVRDILDNFKFHNQLSTLSKSDSLGTLIGKFLDPEIDLSPAGIDNHSMGTVFEELVRKFNEENNEEAGEHWTPRDAVKLRT